MNVIFTDIDGVLFNLTSTKWNKKAIYWYNRLCSEFNLKAVISSTWRKNHTKHQLQNIFIENGIEVDIFDYTPISTFDDRGEEIVKWLTENHVDNYLILDDCIRDIEKRKLNNVIKCRGWIGFSEEEYNLCRELLLNQNPVF